MINDKSNLMARTKQFALRVIRMYSTLSKSTVAQVLGRQVLRSGTSVGAHYREANRARSTPEFVSKLEVAIQELDETRYWFELMVEAKLVRAPQLAALQAEATKLTAILTSSAKTAKARK